MHLTWVKSEYVYVMSDGVTWLTSDPVGSLSMSGQGDEDIGEYVLVWCCLGSILCSRVLF